MNKISLAMLTLIALASCSKKQTDAAGAGNDLPVVDVATPLVDSITIYKTYPGYAGANATAKIVARVNGTLLTKQFSGGEVVAKGTVLYTIEPTQYIDAVRQAEASLATAKSNYEYYSKQYAALKKAYESDAVAQIEVSQAQSNVQNAEASIKQAEAALSTARTNLSYCTIRAPFTGRINDGNTDPGNYISGEGAPYQLAELYDDTKLNVTFAIEENQYEKIVGNTESPTDHPRYDRIPLTFTEKLPHDYYGDLNYEAPVVDKSTGTVTLKVKVDNPYGELRNGMYVTVNMPAEENPRALLISDAAIGTDQLGKYIYVVNDSNKVVYTPIKIGNLYQDSLRVVTEGISANTRYVTKAMLKVRDGMTVNPKH